MLPAYQTATGGVLLAGIGCQDHATTAFGWLRLLSASLGILACTQHPCPSHCRGTCVWTWASKRYSADELASPSLALSRGIWRFGRRLYRWPSPNQDSLRGSSQSRAADGPPLFCDSVTHIPLLTPSLLNTTCSSLFLPRAMLLILQLDQVFQLGACSDCPPARNLLHLHLLRPKHHWPHPPSYPHGAALTCEEGEGQVHSHPSTPPPMLSACSCEGPDDPTRETLPYLR